MIGTCASNVSICAPDASKRRACGRCPVMRINPDAGTGSRRQVLAENQPVPAFSGRDFTAQFIGNMGVNDVVERGLGLETERHAA
jgi:hypothetical protein